MYNKFFCINAVIFLIHHIRKLVLLFSSLLAIGIYLFITNTIQTSSLQDIRLTQTYALTAVSFLYAALIATPLYAAFPRLSIKPIHIRARRALGQSTFLFAMLHLYFAFFKLLGGFGGLFYLPANYLIAISLSFTAFIILTLMAATSFDIMVKKLGKHWKTLHRFVYLAALFITIHALMLGSNFTNLNSFIPQIFFIALAILLILEALRLDKYLTDRFSKLPSFGLSMTIVIGIIVWASVPVISKTTTATNSLGIHASHIQLAQQAQSQGQTLLPNLPGLNGDRSKRYTVSFDHPPTVEVGKPVELKFSVFDAASGNPVTLFSRPYEKFMHLIIVDDTLTSFEHLHPDKNGGTFTTTQTFTKAATYHLYTDFQPVGGIDQQIAFTLPVGVSRTQVPAYEPDKNLTKTFGDYQITLKTSEVLSAAKMSLGKQTISFTIVDKTTKKGVSNLKPYLGSFGHLVMINETTFDYLHVHPTNLTLLPANAKGGPTVDFLPIGIYGAFKEGNYRVFAQFNHNGNLLVADFTVKVGK